MAAQAETGLIAQEIVYAGMDAQRWAVPLDLCAYLHATSGQGPQLFLSTPDLSSVDPTEAFNLFSALRDALEHDHEGDETLLLGGFLAMGVTTAGPASRGLHVAGRRETPLEEPERDVLRRIARAFGGAAHALESTPLPEARASAAGSPVRVAVEMVAGSARAEVATAVGEEIRTGVAEGPTPARAVALAVLDAIDSNVKLLDTHDGDIGTERAVLVLVADDVGRSEVGSALVTSDTDVLRATAAATLEACARLR